MIKKNKELLLCYVCPRKQYQLRRIFVRDKVYVDIGLCKKHYKMKEKGRLVING